MTTPFEIDGLFFRELDGVLYASDTHQAVDADWGVVTTIPVDDYETLIAKFKVAMGRFHLATVEGYEPPEGRIYIRSCPPKKDDDDDDEEQSEIEDVTPDDEDPKCASFRLHYYSVMKSK